MKLIRLTERVNGGTNPVLINADKIVSVHEERNLADNRLKPELRNDNRYTVIKTHKSTIDCAETIEQVYAELAKLG